MGVGEDEDNVSAHGVQLSRHRHPLAARCVIPSRPHLRTAGQRKQAEAGENHGGQSRRRSMLAAVVSLIPGGATKTQDRQESHHSKC